MGVVREPAAGIIAGAFAGIDVNVVCDLAGLAGNAVQRQGEREGGRGLRLRGGRRGELYKGEGNGDQLHHHPTIATRGARENAESPIRARMLKKLR